MRLSPDLTGCVSQNDYGQNYAFPNSYIYLGGPQGFSKDRRLELPTKGATDVNAVDLNKVYQTLNAKLVLERKKTEVTALFAGLAALLAVVSAALSLAWFHRIV